MNIALGMLGSYLIGSVPTAYIFGRLYKGIDIRQFGSGNVGATNVFRVLGRWPGVIVLVFDILKGTLAVAGIADLLGLTQVLQRALLAVCVVSGHNWTIFLKFKGGKGIAASLGVLIGLAIRIAAIRPVLLFTVLVWIFVFLAAGFVSLASIAASAALPVIMVITGQSLEIVALGILTCLFVVIRHRPNIKRLLAGEEHRANWPFRRRGSGDAKTSHGPNKK